MPHISGFSDCFSLSHFLAKKSNIWRLDVLHCCCGANQYSKIACVFSKIKKKTVCTLRVNETKLQETLLLAIFLYYKVRKNQKMTKGPFFETAHRFLNCLLTLRPQMQHTSGFPDCFSFCHFLATSCHF